VYDVSFRPVFGFFVIDVNTKRVVHVAVTREPSERWTAQQLRNATPFAAGPRFVIRDRDAKFGADFDRVAKGAAIRLLKTAVQAPLMNATCERFLGSVRRECLDHVIILGEDHLRSVLSEYVEYFNASRPHQGIAQRVPVPNPAKSSALSGNVVASPVLGGLSTMRTSGRRDAADDERSQHSGRTIGSEYTSCVRDRAELLKTDPNCLIFGNVRHQNRSSTSILALTRRGGPCRVN
jgi:hypothetical protein